MSRRFNAMERQFWLTCALAGVAAVGAWTTAVRFQEARTIRQEVATTETILEQCRKLPAAMSQLDQKAQRYLATGTTADLLTYRAAQQGWAEAVEPMWEGVRRDPQAMALFSKAVLGVQRWQDRTVEARLAGAPASPIAPALMESAMRDAQTLIGLEKTLYANRLEHRTAPTTDFFLFGFGSLMALAGAGALLRRQLLRDHFQPLEQLSLSAADLVEGEGLVPPPDHGGEEIAKLAHHVHHLGLRYLGTRHDLHQYQKQLTSLAELAGLKQTAAPRDLLAAAAEHAARQLEARAAVIALQAGGTVVAASAFGTDTTAISPFLPSIFAALQAARSTVVWHEPAAFPADLQSALTNLRCHALIATPVWQGAAMVGMILVWHGAGRTWPEPQPAYLQALAGMVAVDAPVVGAPILPARRTIGETIATARDGKQRQWALELALEEAIRSFPGAIAELLLVQPDGRTLAVAAAHGLPPGEWDGSRTMVGEGIVGQAEQTGVWTCLADVGKQMHLIGNPYLRHWGPRSLACAPLPRFGGLRGVLVMYSRKPNTFAEAEGSLLGLASQVGLGLQAAQAESLALESVHDWDTVLQLNDRLQSALNAQEVCRAWVDVVQETFPAARGAIYLQEPDGTFAARTSFGMTANPIHDPTTCHALATQRTCGGDLQPCYACEGHGGTPGHLCLPLRWSGTLVGMAHLGGMQAMYWSANRTRLAEVMAAKLVSCLVSTQRQAQR